MFTRLIAAGSIAALVLVSAPVWAQEADAAQAEVQSAPRVFDPVNFDAQVDRENILVLDLSNGERVQIRLMESWAPAHVERVKTLARQGFYDGIIFHRVIEGFMAQTGDPTGTGQGGSQLADLEEEFNPMPHLRGTVSMAREAQSEDSANSQFFINFYPRFSLDRQYTNFGRVIGNMAGVDAIARGEPPAEPTRILQASIAADNRPVPPMPVASPAQDDPQLNGITADMLSAPVSE
ncbi:MAG: peptidylprolyl isomerase [Pontixanthobacter sp.]